MSMDNNKTQDIIKSIEYTTGIDGQTINEVFKALQLYNLLNCMKGEQEEYSFDIPYFGSLYCKYKGTTDYKKKPMAVVDTNFKPFVDFLYALDNAVNEDPCFSNELEKDIMRNIDKAFLN